MSPDHPYNAHGQLTEVVLTEVNFRRNASFDISDTTVSYSLDTGIRTEISSAHGQGMAHLNAELGWHAADERIDGPFELALVVTGIFEGFAQDLPDEEIDGWLSFNGEHLLWPYLRAYISQLTVASGLPQLTIYTVAVPRPHFGVEDAVALEVEPS